MASIQRKSLNHPDEVRPFVKGTGIMALAGASEILASSLTVGLADGSGLQFEEAGRHEVKGIGRPIEVFRLVA